MSNSNVPPRSIACLVTGICSLMLIASGCASPPKSSDSSPSDSASKTQTSASAQTADQDSPDSDDTEKPATLRLTRDDVATLADRLTEDLLGSKLVAEWSDLQRTAPPPKVAIIPLKSATTPPDDKSSSQLSDAIKSALIQDSGAQILPFSVQKDVFEASTKKHRTDYHAALVDFGQTLNASYVLSGKFTANKSITADTDNVTYLVSLQAIDSADGSVAYQTTTQLTKSR